MAFLGRIDGQVKLRGFRIELGEIEVALGRHAAVREAVAVLREDRPGVKRLVAYVVPAETLNAKGGTMNGPEWSSSAFSVQRSALAGELRAHLQKQLPDYMLPAAFVLLDALPLTPNGKLDRRALPAPDSTSTLEAFVAPRTHAEQQLARIWGDVLGLEQVSVNANFFALGGDSILSIQIIARATQAGLRLTPKQMFQHQTIAEVAAVAGMLPASVAEQGLVVGPVPLTPIQRHFFARELRDQHHFNQALLLAVWQKLDPPQLARAVQHVLAHHDALRLRFTQTAAGWQQRNAANEPNTVFAHVDLTVLPPPAQGPAIEAAATALQASLDLAHGPIVRIVLFGCGVGQPDRLLLIVHHLAIDAVSWSIVLEDLQTAYAQLSRGIAVALPPKTSSFKHWAERLSSYAQSAQLRAEATYWLATAHDALKPLPLDYPAGSNIVASTHDVSVELDEATTRALLRDVPPVYQTQINDVLLTALALAFARWTGAPALLIDLEGHGREDLFEDVDLTRTVGWYTALFPVLLNLEHADGPTATLKAIKEQLRAIPNHGVGYGVLRYLSDDQTLHAQLAAAMPQVSFNYLGQSDQVMAEAEAELFGPAQESSGPVHSPHARRSHLLDVTSVISEGRLRIAWTYSDTLHRRATITRLAEGYLAALRALIAACLASDAGGYTPSDFPLAQLDQPTLDQVAGRDRQIEEIYPLSPMQQGMLFHTLYDPQSGVYVEQIALMLHGDIQLPLFQRAWQRIVERHAVLRTSFVWENVDEPLQIVHRQASVAWSVADWRGCSSGNQAERLATFLAADRKQGFDLRHAPLMRLALFQVAPDAHQFVWSQHHVLMDGWSLPLVLNEVFACYEAFVQDREAQLARPQPYRDYIAWLQRQDMAQAEAFWRQTLSGFSAPTALGVDQPPAPDAGPPEQGEQQSTLAEPTISALQSLARQHGLTFNTLVQGAWALLLSHYSGQNDIIFGATVSGRPADLAGVETMIGLFINTVPVRVRIAPDAALLPWLEQLQAQQAEVRQYEYSPLAEVQGWSSVPHGQPLFESLVVFENYPVEQTTAQGERPGVMIGEVQGVEQTNYPLALAAGAGGLRINYDKRRFDDATIMRMSEHVQALLEGMATGHARRLADLSPITAAERRQLLVDWNATTTAAPDVQCLHQLFEMQSAATPDAVALAFIETKDEGRKTNGKSAPFSLQPSAFSLQPSAFSLQLSYRELNTRADQLARHLRSLGVRPDDRIGICVERSLELVVGLLGILKAGCGYVPLDPAYPAERLAFMLADAQITLLLTHQRLVAGAPPPGIQVLCLDTDWSLIAQPHPANLPARVTADNLAYVIYTSGSTGTPKGVMITHRAICNHMHWMHTAFPLVADDRVLQKTPVSFDASVWEFYAPLIAGAQLIMAQPGGQQDSGYLIATIVRQQVTILQVVPTLLRMLLEERDLASCTSLRRVFCGGEALPTELARRFQTQLAADIYNLYGPTEAAIDTTYAQYDPANGRSAVPIGRPISNTQIYLLNAQGGLVPIGVPGELYIGGAGLARGYLGRPDLTAERFVPNPFAEVSGAGYRVLGAEPSDTRYPTPDTRLYKTGDLARYLPDGAIEFLGRLDHQLKLRGYRIELGEVAAVLERHPTISAAAVVARTDAPGDARLVAYVVLDAAAPPSIGAVRSFLQAHLPDYMLPTTLIRMNKLPLTPNGKVDQRALPAPDQAQALAQNAYNEPRDSIEFKLTQIWEDILDVQPIGVLDNFFDLGGHSLLVLRLTAQIQKHFGRTLSLSTLFRVPTIAQLACVLREQTGYLPYTPLVELRGSGSKPPLFLVHPGGGTTFCYTALARHLGPDQPCYGLQARGVEDQEEPCSIMEQLATHYIAALRVVQPHGPYFIGGWSMGGMVAFEMAQQLQQHGEQVGLLAVIDAAPVIFEGEERQLNDEAAVLASFIGEKNLPMPYEEFRRLGIEGQLRCAADMMRKTNFVPPDTQPEQISRILQVFRANEQAVKDYALRPYSGHLTLLRTVVPIIAEPGRKLNIDPTIPSLGWDNYSTQPVEIHMLPGDHETVIRDPNVAVLAERISACIAAYLDQQELDHFLISSS